MQILVKRKKPLWFLLYVGTIDIGLGIFLAITNDFKLGSFWESYDTVAGFAMIAFGFFCAANAFVTRSR